MSFFGKNIKKIRGVKGLSQQAFADLFNLKRGTLGAYEEGRSEPKIETIIKIANYFSITIDNLLVQELTVNALLKFKGDFSAYTQKSTSISFNTIPCITEEKSTEYIFKYQEHSFIETLPNIQLPLDTRKNLRAYTVSNLEMTTAEHGFYPNDILIGEYTPITNIKHLETGVLVFAVVDEKLLFRRMYLIKDDIILRADHKRIEDETFPITKLKELWEVRYVFCKRIPDFSKGLDDKIQAIEQELLHIKSKLK